jgi:CRP/FNR family transcriptional regulator, anaerobic regulatory protein
MKASVDEPQRFPSRGPAPVHLRVVAATETAKEIRLHRGQTLFFDDDLAEAFFEIAAGTVRCCRLTSDGRRQIYRFAAAGDLLGLAGSETYGYSAEAVTDVVVKRHRLLGLDGAMAADGDLCRRVLRALRAELAATRAQMMLLGRMSAAEKLASFLLALAAPDPEACIELPMTRSDIADYLGLTIETVSRKLNELRAQGVIRLETPSRIRITDLGRIEAITEAA